MSSKYLGKQFDIHTGGIDHIQVHHTNEIAQSESCFGKKPWVKYWLHNEFLVLEKEKMAKSKGNLLTLQTLIEKGYNPLAYKYFLLGTHYRKPITFSFKALDSAQNTYEKLKNKVLEMLEQPEVGKENTETYIEDFQVAINDDLNIPKALGTIWQMLRNEKVNNAKKYKTLIEFDRVLGLELETIKVEKLSKTIQNLIDQREHARLNKHWQDADKLRDQLKEKGYLIEDTPQGVRWKKV